MNYQTPDQRDRFQKLADDLDLDLATLERVGRDPAAFESALLRRELGPIIRVLTEAMTTRPQV